MTYDFSMSGNFSAAGQLSFFQMPYIQVARQTGWARDVDQWIHKWLFVHLGTGDWDEVTDIHGWSLIFVKSSEECR